MLKKLMKYELKATSRLLIPLYLIMLFMSVVNRFVSNTDSDITVIKITYTFLAVIYGISIFMVLITSVLYMVARFYKNLLTDEGYLMFTLPVKTHMHIISKLIITLFWLMISIAAVFLSLFITFGDAHTLPDIINGVKQVFSDFVGVFGGASTVTFIEIIIMFLLSIIVNILFVYLSIAVGQLYTKHKIIGSFAAYLIIYTVIQFLMALLVVPLGLYFSNHPIESSVLPTVIFPLVIVVLAIGCAAFYLGTNYMFKKRLNLD